MKKQLQLLILFSLVLANTVVFAQTTTPDAEVVLKNAYRKAATENKKVLLIFHASWCVWCKKMDSSIIDKSCSKFFNDNFIIEHITVLESKGKENLENPGGEALMNQFNGKNQGLPYWVVLDKNRKLLFDSQIRKTQPDGTVKGSNIGCPASKDEVKAFINILRETTPLKDNELSIISNRFLLNQ